MKKEQEYLLKHFASRAMALGKPKADSIEANVAHCLSRKELIEIIKKRFAGTIPKEHNLIEMEKPQLLALIENEMLIISYMAEKWSKQVPKEIVPVTPKKAVAGAEKKSTNNKKPNDKTS